MKNIRCNKCGYVGDESKFPTGRDFLQTRYITDCPKCDNHQSPGDASLRMFPGAKHPFEFVRAKPTRMTVLEHTLWEADEAS